MRFTSFRFQILSALLLSSVGCATVLGSSGASVTTTAVGTVTTSCTQSGTSASCSVSAPSGVNGPTLASGLATSTFDSPGGRMELQLDAFGPGASASGGVSYSVPVIVIGTGTTGSLAVTTNGFAQINNPGNGAVSTPFLGMLADGRFFSTGLSGHAFLDYCWYGGGSEHAVHRDAGV